MLISIALPQIRFLRMLRAIRSLKFMRWFERFRVVFTVIFKSFAGLLQVSFIIFYFVFLFGLVGYKLFAGYGEECNNKASWVKYRSDCSGFFFNALGVMTHARWSLPQANFETLPAAMKTVFEISMGNDWLDKLYRITDITAPNRVPVPHAHDEYMIYIIVIILIQGYVFKNALVGVLMKNFDEIRGLGTLTRYQQDWMYIRSLINARSAFRIRWYCYTTATASKSRKYASSVVLHPWFEIVSCTVVFLNIIQMAIRYNSSSTHGILVIWSDMLFLSFYIFECALKIIIMRWRAYFSNPWNIFDVLVILGTIADYLAFLSMDDTAFSALIIVSLSQFFRCLRVFKLAALNVGHLQFLFSALVHSLLSVMSAFVILSVCVFIGATLCVYLFSNVRYGLLLNENWNFRNITNSFLALLRTLTGDKWEHIAHDLEVQYPFCTENSVMNDCGGGVSILFIPFFGFVGSLVVVPFAVAIVIDTYSVCYGQFKLSITQADLAIYHREFERIVASTGEDKTYLNSHQLQLLCCILHAEGSPLVRNVHPHIQRFRYRQIVFDLQEIGRNAQLWNGFRCECNGTTSTAEEQMTYQNVLAVLAMAQGGAESLDHAISRARRRRYEKARNESIAIDIITRAVRRWLRHDVWKRDPALCTADNMHKAHVWRNIDLFCSFAMNIAEDVHLAQITGRMRPKNALPDAIGSPSGNIGGGGPLRPRRDPNASTVREVGAVQVVDLDNVHLEDTSDVDSSTSTCYEEGEDMCDEF